MPVLVTAAFCEDGRATMGRSQHDMDDAQRGTHAVLHERYTAHGRKVLVSIRNTGPQEQPEMVAK